MSFGLSFCRIKSLIYDIFEKVFFEVFFEVFFKAKTSKIKNANRRKKVFLLAKLFTTSSQERGSVCVLTSNFLIFRNDINCIKKFYLQSFSINLAVSLDPCVRILATAAYSRWLPPQFFCKLDFVPPKSLNYHDVNKTHRHALPMYILGMILGRIPSQT
jgi:hypothetical protein